MTEAEWESCTDSAAMYRFIRFQPGVIRSKAGRRKLRLFGVACCRKLGRLISDSRSLAALEVAERQADGLASQEEASLAEKEAWQAFEEAWQHHLKSTQGGSHCIITEYKAAMSAALLLDRQADNYGGAGLCHFPVATDAPDYRTYRKRGQWQADVLRCVFGNPFRPVSIELGCLTPTVTNLAKAVYDKRRLPGKFLSPERLTLLADALEEAGCTTAEILAHCRGPGPHVRGCWVIDLLLPKKE